MGYNRNLDRQNAASYTLWQKHGSSVFGVIVIALFAAAYAYAYMPNSKAEANLLPAGTVITSIYWSDGDSGRANEVPFRLSDVDAPETGGVGAAIGGAKCESEREWGFRAKEFMVSETKRGELVITENYGQDQYGRWVIDISSDSKDLGETGRKNDVIRSWRHEGEKALEPRPDWCGSQNINSGSKR